MPIQPILCLYLNGLLTTVDILQKQSVLRWSHVRCSVAQWWIRTIVITEKTGSHRPTSGPAALMRDHLSMNISFFSPWFLQGCTNRQESRAVLKKSDGAATAQRKSCEFHRFSWRSHCLRVKFAMDTHGVGDTWVVTFVTTEAVWLLWLLLACISNCTQFVWSSVLLGLSQHWLHQGLEQLFTLGSRHLLQHLHHLLHHRRHHPPHHSPRIRSCWWFV